MEMEPGKLFIGGISWDTSEERLREYFRTFGEIVEAVIMRDRTTGRARGFGFIVFADASVAEKVVRERHVIDGRTVEAKKAVPRDDNQNLNKNNGSIQGSPGPARTKKIFVGGLASTVTEAEFKTYFDQFGTITDVVVMYDHNTQRPRGFGFITYDSEEAVDKVLFRTFHELKGKMVEVKRAVPKELSPGPARTQSGGGGFNYGLNRVNSFLNAYTQGYSNSNSPMRMEGWFSPVTTGRTGYPPFSPSNYNNVGLNLNLDSGYGLNYGPDPDIGLAFGRGVNSSYYNENTNRFGGGSVGYDAGPGGNGPFVNRNLWGDNGSLNHNSNNLNSNAFVGGSGTRNTTSTGIFGNIGEIWGSAVSARGGGGGGSLGGRTIGYGTRKNGGGATSYGVAKNIRDEGLGILYGSESFYGDHGWRSSSPELGGSANFGFGGDVTPNNPVGYVGGYMVDARTNRGGIAA